jgi:alpha-beta hydrolase superfamily lysophospholipase
MLIDISIRFAKLPHGLVYFYQHWLPAHPKALVVFLPGLGDHCGRYSELSQRMVREDFAFVTYDQRGNGQSEGPRGHLDRFADWVEDLASFVNFSLARVPEGTPLFIVGQSLGAIVAINYLLTHAQRVAGMLLLSAAFVPQIRIPRWQRKLGAKLHRLLPRLSVSNRVGREALTRDSEELAKLHADVLFHDRMTVAAGREIFSNLELVGGFPSRIHIPMFLAAGSADSVCDPRATRWFADRLSSMDKQCRIYDGMFHDLLHDIGREQVQNDMCEWILARAAEVKVSKDRYLLKRGEALWENVSQPA